MVVGVVVILVVLVAATYTYRTWWTKPNAFGSVGNEYGTRQRADAMRPLSVEMSSPSLSDEPVTLNGARANVVVNTADADFAFVVCHRTEPFIALSRDTSSLCDKAVPVDGQHLSGTDYEKKTIVMTVTPHRAGRVEVNGMTVDYGRGARHLWQRGAEATGPVVILRVK